MKIKLKSVRTRLFLSLCVIVILAITFLIVLNNLVLEKYYLYNKEKTLTKVYNMVNECYNNKYSQEYLNGQLDQIAVKNDFDIIIRNANKESIYISSKNFFENQQLKNITSKSLKNDNSKILSQNDKYIIGEYYEYNTNIKYILIEANLDNGYSLYIRLPITSIQESIKILNEFLYIISIFVIIFGGILLLIVTKRFSEPIEELDNIAKKMSNLDFSQKYVESGTDNEIDHLGKSINTLSTKLENTIAQLKQTNLELEKDVEEKSQINEMRKSFISDVSHELKTPIALIQGYSEGLVENVNADEESRKFYAEVILDEAIKMDKLVKQLLELMKLEYGKLQFNNSEFNIVDIEKEILRKSQVMIEKENIETIFNQEDEIIVNADEFYIDQIITNYITNAIKYATEINGKKVLEIKNEILDDQNKVRVTVFNTFDGMSEEDMIRIWNRFYKIDESRNREKGGNGIGLSLVKAIMNNYENSYGVKNVAGGVEFYFDLDLKSK